ncbi:MAG: universal stress protein [Bacteroidales bacterium]|nr:universal stress protein [Bacteroidales bacterium]
MKLAKERIITVGHFTWSRALLMQIILQDSGIDCFAVPKDTVLPRGYADLRVKEADLEKALKIIDLASKETGSAKENAIHRIQVVRRIMVPVDFSDISFDASRFAVSLASKFKAEVKLVHIFYNPAIDVSPYADHYSYQIKLVESLREIEKSARENMIKLEHKLKMWCIKENLAQIRVTAKLINGFSTDEILNYSKVYKPAIIIMGTRGLTRDNYKAFGRVASKVIENSDIPVLALPSGTAKTIGEIKSVMYATDLDPSDYSALNRLIQMMAPFKIKIHCVHICFVEKKPWDSVKLEELKVHLKNEYKGIDISFNNIVSDNVVNGLETYIRDNDIDALAVTTHKRNLLEKIFIPSVSRKIYSETGKPLLVFHARE